MRGPVNIHRLLWVGAVFALPHIAIGQQPSVCAKSSDNLAITTTGILRSADSSLVAKPRFWSGSVHCIEWRNEEAARLAANYDARRNVARIAEITSATFSGIWLLHLAIGIPRSPPNFEASAAISISSLLLTWTAWRSANSHLKEAVRSHNQPIR